MKLVFWAIVTIAVVGNFGLQLRGEAMLLRSGLTADQWNRTCRYYYPFRTFIIQLPLSQACPSSMKAP